MKSFLQLNLIILLDFHSFTVNEDKLQNLSIWRFFLRSGYAILVKIWKFLNFLILFHSSRKHKVIMFTIEFDHFDWLSQLYSEWRQTSKLVNLKIFSKLRVCNFGQNLKIPKLLNSVPFIKKTQGNHVHNWIWSFWLTFIVLQWMKTNFKISEFEDFC